MKMNMPKYFYHHYRPGLRDVIKKEGLKPMIGPSYSEHYEEFNNLDENDKKRIFPGLDEKDYKQEIYPCIFLASKVDTYGYDDGWCSVKIKCEDIDKNYLEPDFVMGMNKKCFRYKKSIPAAKLEFCHERY